MGLISKSKSKIKKKLEAQQKEIELQRQREREEHVVKYKLANGRKVNLTKEEYWETIVYNIMVHAPILQKLLSLPVKYIDGNRFYCNGVYNVLGNDFHKQPFEDGLYIVISDYINILLGNKVKPKELDSITTSNIRKKIILLQKRVVDNCIVNSLLFNKPEEVGVNRLLINPSDNMIRQIALRYIPDKYKQLIYEQYSSSELKRNTEHFRCRKLEQSYDRLAEPAKLGLLNSPSMDAAERTCALYKISYLNSRWADRTTSQYIDYIIMCDNRSFNDKQNKYTREIKYLIDIDKSADTKSSSNRRVSHTSSNKLNSGLVEVNIPEDVLETLYERQEQDMLDNMNKEIQKNLVEDSEDNNNADSPEVSDENKSNTQSDKDLNQAGQQTNEEEDSSGQGSDDIDSQSSKSQQDNADSQYQDSEASEYDEQSDSSQSGSSQDASGNSSSGESAGSSFSSDDYDTSQSQNSGQDFDGGSPSESNNSGMTTIKSAVFGEDNPIQDIYNLESILDDLQNRLEQTDRAEDKYTLQNQSYIAQPGQSVNQQLQKQQHEMSSINDKIAELPEQHNVGNIEDIDNQSSDIPFDIPIDKLNDIQDSLSNKLDDISEQFVDSLKSFDDYKNNHNHDLSGIEELEVDSSEIDFSDNNRKNGDTEVEITNNLMRQIKDLVNTIEYQKSDILDSILNEDDVMSDSMYASIMTDINNMIENGEYSLGGHSCKLLRDKYTNLLTTTTTWYEQLKKLLTSVKPNQQMSYLRPDKRYLYQKDTILPSKSLSSNSNDIQQICVWLDSSFSMSDKDFLIMQSILKTCNKLFPRKVKAYEFNDEVNELKVSNGRIVERPHTGGGTDIRCVLSGVDKNYSTHKTLHIIVSDGGFNWSEVKQFLKEKCKKSILVFLITSSDTSRYLPRDYDTEIVSKKCKIFFTSVDGGTVQIKSRY